MPALIFNKEKHFWNPATRAYQPEPVLLRSDTEVRMEFRMATRSDWTADTIWFEEPELGNVLEHVAGIDMSEERLSALKDIHDSYLSTRSELKYG